MTKELNDQRFRDHEYFYCPNGHGLAYTSPSEADRLRTQLAQEQHNREQVEAARTELANQRDHLERRVAAQRGVVTRVRNRAKNGMCPCCKRHLPELHRHMQTEHPEFQATEGFEA